MSSDNVNAAADDSFVFDDKANFEEDYTEKPKDKKEEYKSTQQMSAWDPKFVNQQNKLQLQEEASKREAERLALMRAPLGSTNGKPNSATNMTNFETYWNSGNEEAERLALMRAPIDSIPGDKGSDTDMTNFESYWKPGKGGSKRKRRRSKSKTRSRKQKRSRKQNRRRSSKR